MIKYNIRFNGSWEYDKFVLNYYNLANEIKLLKEKLLKLESQNESINDTYKELVESNILAKTYRQYSNFY